MFSVDPAKGEKGAPLAVYLAGIHAEDVEQVTGALNHALATGEKYIQEYRLLQKDRRTERSAGSRRVASA